MTGYHGTSQTDWTPHVGACLADTPEMAATYGEIVYVVEVDMSGLTKAVVSDEAMGDIWADDYAPLSAIVAAAQADGWDGDEDVIVYADTGADGGCDGDCYRLMTPPAMVAAWAKVLAE